MSHEGRRNGGYKERASKRRELSFHDDHPIAQQGTGGNLKKRAAKGHSHAGVGANQGGGGRLCFGWKGSRL